VFTNPKDMEMGQGQLAGRGRLHGGSIQKCGLNSYFWFSSFLWGVSPGHKQLTCLASLRDGCCLPAILHWKKSIARF